MTERADNNTPRPPRSSALALGAATLLASGLFRQGLGVLTLVVTARLLTPEDFGIIAYFLIVTMFLGMMQQQIIIALIRLKTVTPEHLNTVFTLQVLFAILTSFLIWVSLPTLAWFGLSELRQLGPALIGYSLLLPFTSPRFVLFERELRFAPAAIVETILRTSYSISVVLLAWWWRDFWAVVAATFVGQIFGAAWTFKLAPMIPRLSLVKWRDSITFSTWAMGAQIAQFLSRNLPLMLIGSALGLAEAGLFRLGNRITMLVTTQFFAPMQRVLFPGLADASRETDRQAEVFMKMNSAVLAIVLPISIGTALLAEDVIRLAMGEKWLAAAQVIWILAPLKAFETLQANVRAAIYVDGATRLLFFRNLALLATTTLFMWIGVRFGFSGAVISAGLSSLAATVFTLLLARRFTTGGFFAPLLAGWRGFAATAAMTAAILLVGIAIRSALPTAPLLLGIIAKIAIGTLVYPSTLLLLWSLSGKPDGLERFLLAAPGHLRQRLARRRVS